MTKAPTAKKVKIYAVLESVIEGRQESIDEYLKENKFRGNVTTNYSQGGITTIITKEIIPLTMKQLDKISMMGTEENITPQEQRILQLLADGKRPKDIAVSLHLSINVVNIYLVRIREKYEATTTYNAIATAIRQGIID